MKKNIRSYSRRRFNHRGRACPVRLLFGFLAAAVSTAASANASAVYLNFSSNFDTDTILETGGTGLTDPLDTTRDRIDGGTLPSTYSDGATYTTTDGLASFTFAKLKTSSLDAVSLKGQTLTIEPSQYASIDLALLAAPGSCDNPFTTIKFNYTDGTSDEHRFGPLQSWISSPAAYDHTYYTYVDSSAVTSIVKFNTDFGDAEAAYLFDSSGNGNDSNNRFVDGNGYALYKIPVATDLTAATLGITVGNNFDIFVATAYADPTASPLDGYTEIANSMTLYDGTEHKALGNLKLYEFDMAPYLAAGSGELYILFKDATPDNGWGPYIENIQMYTGTNRQFAAVIAPDVNTNQATVYAQFLTDGGTNEAPYLYDNSGSGPSSRKHRFADGTGSITYKLTFPTAVNDAKLTVDMANNFVVSLSGPLAVTRYSQVSPGTTEEKNFLVDAGNSVLGSNYRYADASAYMIYQFTLPEGVTNAVAQIDVGNQFVISVAAGTNGDFVVERDYVTETGNPITDNSNLAVYNVQLAPYLTNNPSRIIQIKLTDGVPEDGWGPYLTSIVIANKVDTGENTFTPVLNSSDLFGGIDVHDELNKGYYTLDLSSVLKSNNPNKEVYVKFTDGSTSDGWGPGIFWMAAYSGTLDIQSDSKIFPALKTVNGDPEGFGVDLLRRRYSLNSAKTLKEIVLPAQPSTESNHAYLLAATLNPATIVSSASLAVQRGAANTVEISWPTSAAGYSLQTAETVAGEWSAVTQTVVVQGDNNVVTIPTTSGNARFYRLKK
jgi:hypothetical protein